MPTAEYLDGISETRRLARSLVHEVLGITTPLPEEPPKTTRTIWTREKIYYAVVCFAKAHHRMPRWEEWHHASQHGLPSRSTVQHQWGKLSMLYQAVWSGMRQYEVG